MIKKLWTPRKTLIVFASAKKRENNMRAHIAIEEIVQEWQLNGQHPKAISYYLNLSPTGMTRLINEVSKHV